MDREAIGREAAEPEACVGVYFQGHRHSIGQTIEEGQGYREMKTGQSIYRIHGYEGKEDALVGVLVEVLLESNRARVEKLLRDLVSEQADSSTI